MLDRIVLRTPVDRIGDEGDHLSAAQVLCCSFIPPTAATMRSLRSIRSLAMIAS